MRFLDRIFGKRKDVESVGSCNEKQIVLIDFYEHERGGHFGPWLYWFASEFAKRFDRVFISTPRPESTIQLFRKIENALPDNIYFHFWIWETSSSGSRDYTGGIIVLSTREKSMSADICRTRTV